MAHPSFLNMLISITFFINNFTHYIIIYDTIINKKGITIIRYEKKAENARYLL